MTKDEAWAMVARVEDMARRRRAQHRTGDWHVDVPTRVLKAFGESPPDGPFFLCMVPARQDPNLPDDALRLVRGSAMTDASGAVGAVLTDGTGDMRLAYLAGFFDGEGCIHVGRTIQSRTRDRRNHRPQQTPLRRYFRLSVTVAQNDPRPLQELVERFGGTLNRFASRRAFVWMLNGPQARYALRALLPHLCVKRGEAELALLFQSWLTRGRGARPLTPWEIAERESVVEAMSECKRFTFELEGSNA